MRDLTPLCDLARKHETDKGGRHYRYGGGDSDTCHEYTPVYWDLMHEKRDTAKRILEIGINAGSSLRMWEEFFPNARIIGLDCNPSTLFQTDRITCVQVDQNNPEQLRHAVDWVGGGPFDMIIDDGSHETEHQITSIKTLLPYLTEHGIYVVEDLQNDCRPEIVGDHIPAGFVWEAIKAPGGLGKAHCPCGECRGLGPEQLLVSRRG